MKLFEVLLVTSETITLSPLQVESLIEDSVTRQRKLTLASGRVYYSHESLSDLTELIDACLK